MFFNINKIPLVLLIASWSFTSCQKLITIPANPPSSITEQQQFADSASTMSAVAGVYAYHVGSGFAFSDGRLTYSAGLSADELSYAQTDDNLQFFSYNLTPLNTGISSLWSTIYQALYQVNAVLNGVTNNNNLSAAFKQQVTGEMKVVRALYYFQLINLYGDVPLVTTIDYSATNRLPRASVADVYSRITADLTDARQQLTAAYPSAGRARPNLYMAVALLAKANLYQENWQSAYNQADSVIRLGGYSLVDDVNGVFLDGSTEAIWQLPANQGYYGVADAQRFVPSYVGATPNYRLTTPILTAFEAGDKRRTNWVSSAVIGGQTVYYPYKYKNVQAANTPTEDQMVMRLGELYLIRAEAAAHLNNLPQALADVNAIRTRAGLAASTAGPKTAVLSAIMHERQVELFCEWGNRWYDLKRTGTAATVLGNEKTGYTANAALYPLPQAQIQLNNLLIQNPGF